MTNKYFNPNEDADLFESEERDQPSSRAINEHPLDGSFCLLCNRAHDLSNVDFETKEAIRSYLKLDSPFSNSSRLLRGFEETQSYELLNEMILGFQDYKKNLDKLSVNMPLVRTLFVVLNSITDGQAERVFRVYSIERELVLAHVALKSANNALEDSLNSADDYPDDDDTEQTLAALRLLCDVQVEKISSLSQDYETICEEAGTDPCVDLMTHGLYPDDYPQDMVLQRFMKLVSNMLI